MTGPIMLVRHILILSMVFCVGIATWGCSGRRDYEGPQRFPISGTVTINGNPMDMGTISFLPLSGDQRVSGGPIRDGHYSVVEARGPNAGLYRIEIHWNKGTGKQVWDNLAQQMYEVREEGLPPRFHSKSELTAEVSEDQDVYDFNLTVK